MTQCKCELFLKVNAKGIQLLSLTPQWDPGPGGVSGDTETMFSAQDQLLISDVLLAGKNNTQSPQTPCHLFSSEGEREAETPPGR